MKHGETRENRTDEQEEKPVYEQAYICPRCGYDNPARAGFCFVCGEPLITEMKNIPGYALEWTNEMDEHLRKQFQKSSLDDLKRGFDRRFGLAIPEMMILRRAEALGLVGKDLEALKDEQKPEYLKSNLVWMQGAETARIRGDVSIPENDTVPFNIIVEGNLIAHSGVVFQGGLHVKGLLILGDRNSVMKSIVCSEMVMLGRNTVVEHIVDSDGPVFVRNGVVVGTGEKGGIASGNTVYVELGFSGKTKIYASKGVKVVKDIHDVLPNDIKQIVGKEREHVTPIPAVITVKHPEVRRVKAASPRRTIEQPTPHFETQAQKETEYEKTEITRIKPPKPEFTVREPKIAEPTASFRSFEDRVKEYVSEKESPKEKIGLKELREEAEIKVYNLAVSGYDVNEIGLRLFMDTLEVQAIVNILIAKGFLDENLRPKKRETTENLGGVTPQTVQEPEDKQGAEHATEQPQDEQETVDDETSVAEQEKVKTAQGNGEKNFSSSQKRNENKEDDTSSDSTSSSDNDQTNSEDAVRELREL